jgi:hypothetical protein
MIFGFSINNGSCIIGESVKARKKEDRKEVANAARAR